MKIIAENLPIDTWYHYTAYCAHEQQIVETSDLVYYLSGGCLFSYDKKNDESYSYSIQNKLNDSYITGIYYNYDKKYLLIAYESGNIDLLYSDGSIINMSDIKESGLNISKTINSVAFDKDKIYVATEFGIVIFDDVRHEVIQSGIYDKSITAIAVVGDYIVINNLRDIYIAKTDELINNFDKFIFVYSQPPVQEIYALSSSSCITRGDDNALYITTFDFENDTAERIKVSESHVSAKILDSDPGAITYVADNVMYRLDENNREVKVCDLPEEFSICVLGALHPLKSLWSINRDGLSNHLIGSDGTFSIAMQRFRPEEFSVSKVYYFFPSIDDKYLYVQNLGTTSYKFGKYGERGTYNIQNAARIDLNSGNKKDITLYPVNTRVNSDPYSKLGLYASACSSLAPDIDDPDTYFLSSADGGVYKVKNGKLVGKYDETNSPFRYFDGRIISYGVNVDKGGNLWVNQNHAGYTQPGIFVLPSAKRKLDPSQVKESDWIVPPLITELEYWGGQDMVFLNCKKSGVIFMLDNDKNNQIAVYDTRGTFNDFSDDRFYVWERFTDQDGLVFMVDRQVSVCEDHDGKIWFGTNQGVIELPSATKATDPSMTVTRLKVPRNDGTNAADYLLGFDMINSITVDPANRKWIATDVSGLYLVSPEGNEIIKRYNTSNSPLISNRINAVYADPNSSVIYIGTEQGMYTYTTNASPASPDYSDIYAFPNPVRPDYSGPVYIRGLMENSLVKIADSAGNVISQGRSEGGLYTWDGCNMFGSRVPTGIYYVFVSENSSGSSSGAVTKIMVVN